ncbi:hypothetical protein Tco_1237457 [Tanacetum coccineum]
MDALALTPCYSTFLTTADVPEIFPIVYGQNFDELPTDEVIVSFFIELGHTREINSIIDVVVDQMHQPWRTFATLINRSLSGKTFGLDKIRLSRAQILWGPEMRENKAYKTYLGYATRVTPPKKARKFKKPASPKLTTIPVSPEEPTRKSKRVKRPAMKPTNAPTACVFIRDTHVMSLSKKKEKMTIEKRKGIDFLSKMALIEEAQYEEVRKKSLRNFHKTHLSGFSIVTSAAKIIPSVTNKGISAKPSVPDVTEEESTKSEAKSWGRDKDDSNNDHDSRSEGSDQESDSEENEEDVEDDEAEKDDEFVKTPSNYIDDEDETNVESKVEDNAEGDEDKGIDYTTNQFNDDVDVRLNKIVNADERVSALEKEVAELKKDDLLNTQVTTLVDEHLDSRLGATRDEFMSYLLASITARITEQVKIQLPQILPKEVSNFSPPVIKRMVTKSLEHAVLAKESSQPKSTYEAAALLTKFELKKILIAKMDESQSYLTATEYRECYDGLIKSYDLDKSLFSTYDKVYSLKRSQKDKDKDEDRSARSDRGLKKRKTCKDAEPTKEPTDLDWNVGKTPQQGPTQSWLMTLASSADKPSKTFDELISTPIDFSSYIMNGLKITNLTQETLLAPAFKLLKGTRTNFAELEYDFEECYKALSEKLDWDNPEGGDYPCDLTKPLPLVMNGNHQIVPIDYFFNNDLKYLQGGILTMTYTTSITKTKATQYDLPGIEDMVSNLWSLVKVAYDKHAIWGISHWRDQHKTFYGYTRGLESSHDVYSIKHILAVIQVEVMRKHRYVYLREIEVRRTDNKLYTFKEGDFPRLRINDMEDMLIVVVQNRLTK